MSRKALIVGINNYDNAPLNCCINDAKEMAKILKYNYDQSLNFDVKTEYDTDLKTLRRRCKELFESDPEVALFYFSGHGFSSNDHGYLVTTDYEKDSMGLDMAEVFEMAAKSKARNKIIIIDACHSGIIGSDPFNTYISKISDGMTVMTSSKPEESSLEYDGHGLFTSLLIDALSGGASDILGNVTAGGIYSYIDKCLGPWDQRPVFKTNISSFVPIIRNKPLIELNKLKMMTEFFEKPNDEYQLNPSYEFTNDPGVKHEVKEPYAIQSNVDKLKLLQRFVSLNLVKPNGAEHMYFAAMESKSCVLTKKGKYYHKLIKEGKI